MTDTEAKALALVNEVRVEARMALNVLLCQVEHDPIFIALCRAIEREAATEARHAAELREQAERFEAFRQEVSDAVEGFWNYCRTTNTPFPADLDSFILPKPDPLVEVMNEMGFGRSKTASKEFLAAIEKRGGRIVWGEG